MPGRTVTRSMPATLLTSVGSAARATTVNTAGAATKFGVRGEEEDGQPNYFESIWAFRAGILGIQGAAAIPLWIEVKRTETFLKTTRLNLHTDVQVEAIMPNVDGGILPVPIQERAPGALRPSTAESPHLPR